MPNQRAALDADLLISAHGSSAAIPRYHAKADWQFTTADARVKLNRL